MNHKEFNEFANDFIDRLRDTIIQANHEYSHSGDEEFSDSAFANFETSAKDLGLTREQVNRVFCQKHEQAIQGWLKGIEQKREGVEGRMVDKVAYDIILFAMFLDAKKTESREEKNKRIYDEIVGASDKLFSGVSPSKRKDL